MPSLYALLRGTDSIRSARWMGKAVIAQHSTADYLINV